MSFCEVSEAPITVSKNGHLEPADVAQGHSSVAALPGLLRACVVLVSNTVKPTQNLALQKIHILLEGVGVHPLRECTICMGSETAQLTSL